MLSFLLSLFVSIPFSTSPIFLFSVVSHLALFTSFLALSENSFNCFSINSLLDFIPFHLFPFRLLKYLSKPASCLLTISFLGSLFLVSLLNADSSFDYRIFFSSSALLCTLSSSFLDFSPQSFNNCSMYILRVRSSSSLSASIIVGVLFISIGTPSFFLFFIFFSRNFLTIFSAASM